MSDHEHAGQAPSSGDGPSEAPGVTTSDATAGDALSADTGSADNGSADTGSADTGSADTWSDVRALTVPIVATAVVGIAMTIWGYSRAGGAGLLAGSLGALVSLGFFLGGQLILARILRTNPMISMGAAMAVYLVQILILFIIMAALKNASFFDPRVFGFTIVACVLTWTLTSLTSMKKMSQSLAVPADQGRDRAESQATISNAAAPEGPARSETTPGQSHGD